MKSEIKKQLSESLPKIHSGRIIKVLEESEGFSAWWRLGLDGVGRRKIIDRLSDELNLYSYVTKKQKVNHENHLLWRPVSR